MVYVLLADGFEEMEAVGILDLLRRGGIEAAFAGVTGTEVTGSHNIAIRADLTLEQADPESAEMVVIPGGMKGVENIKGSVKAATFILKAGEAGAYLAAICAGPTVLAQLGVLDRRHAVVYPGLEGQMFSAVMDGQRNVVVDGRVITGEGPGAVFDFGLKLVETLRGEEAARQVRHAACYRH